VIPQSARQELAPQLRSELFVFVEVREAPITAVCFRFREDAFLHYNLCISMKPDKYLKQAQNIAEQYRITKGKKFRMKHCDPNDTGSIKSKDEAAKLLEHGTDLLCDMQAKLYAQDKWAL